MYPKCTLSSLFDSLIYKTCCYYLYTSITLCHLCSFSSELLLQSPTSYIITENVMFFFRKFLQSLATQEGRWDHGYFFCPSWNVEAANLVQISTAAMTYCPGIELLNITYTEKALIYKIPQKGIRNHSAACASGFQVIRKTLKHG